MTPRLERKLIGSEVYRAAGRGLEIKAFLDAYKREPIDSFVILDDETDMGPLIHRLVKTEFDVGLTLIEAEKAIGVLNA